ncbi:PAN domain-containing protein [Henriciella sp. AS95]|uniref:PAN domain-containing protein n=1 Tax=Henriciella sp. AS95 TaxID=3135782 RepID=UPI00316FC016
MFLASANAQTVEFNSDRLGKDFDRVTLHVDDYKLCQRICSDTEQCKAWTYTPAGFNQYETPQCWLKDGISRGFERESAVSGTFPDRVAPDEEVGERPPSDAAAAAWEACKDEKFGKHDYSDLCLVNKAVEEFDASFCDAHQGPLRDSCKDSVAWSVKNKCNELQDADKKDLCLRAVFVEFPSNTVCMDEENLGGLELECHLSLAHETGDRSAFLSKIRNMETEDRDVWIAALAAMELDYDLLELIEDNRTHDQLLTMISANRIGAGRHVEPGVCAAVVGGYTDADGGLNASSWADLCVQTVAMARVVADWADGRSIQEVLELQEQMEDYFESGDPAGDFSDFPMGLGQAMRDEIAIARSDLRVAAVTQSGSTNAEAPLGPVLDLDFDNVEDIPSTSNCVFGTC